MPLSDRDVVDEICRRLFHAVFAAPTKVRTVLLETRSCWLADEVAKQLGKEFPRRIVGHKVNKRGDGFVVTVVGLGE